MFHSHRALNTMERYVVTKDSYWLDNRFNSTGARMPDAGKEIWLGNDRSFGPKSPTYVDTENTPPSFLFSDPTEDILQNFYHTKRVGNYLIGKKLGEGSFAKVHEGLHETTGEKVAVKVIDKRKAKKDSYIIKNLRREGQIQQMIRHPNITQLLDIVETKNSYYLVMELCTGGNLMNHIYEMKKLDESEAQKYVRQLVMAVDHLHRAGVVHRDLKIENLLLDELDNIKLIDFGLSNCNEILGYSDSFSTQCGSPAYAAPELLSRKTYGPKVDVWSIGVNMYAMLTGTLPFTVEPFSLKALHQRMVDKDMNPLPPSISSAAVSLLKRLLEPDPDKRPNIHQVMEDSWLQLRNPHTRVPYLNRIPVEEINHTALLHMTERMGYSNTAVLSAVLTNKASHTLTVYFLLNNKMKRLSKEYREKQYNMEKEKKSEQSKGPTKEKKHKTGFPIIISIPARTPSSLGAHSWASASKEQTKEAPPPPWYKLNNSALSFQRNVSAFQPDRSYLKKATIPSPPVLIVKPQPKRSPSTTDWPSSSESNGSPPSSGGCEEPDSPQHRSKFPSMGIGQILKKVPPFRFKLPPFRLEPAFTICKLSTAPQGLSKPCADETLWPPHTFRKCYVR
ncbi:hormonally up-regulated neu tumor-associated kinase homolog A [Xyrauchen texanus]|uniref:hormonally up-regulated neu tumor-associated kinase homolog A n=1 Tax=Xyrauchen texanus TaxID=154827 RepID=UPI002241E36D|nr:hormonally up-regulated neu tumor-associated kinase homolog A [Xyrauchen texanus]